MDPTSHPIHMYLYSSKQGYLRVAIYVDIDKLEENS